MSKEHALKVLANFPHSMAQRALEVKSFWLDGDYVDCSTGLG